MKAKNHLMKNLARGVLIGSFLLFFFFTLASSKEASSHLRFEISFEESVHVGPITGRIYLIISKDKEVKERLQRGFGHQPVSNKTGEPFFGTDVDQITPGETAVIDVHTLGFPVSSLKDLPPGDYYVQALLNVYTEFHRSDGHVIWAHMDQWDGQHAGWSPGNLISEIKRTYLDPSKGYNIKLKLTKVIPPIEAPADTEWVKRVKIQSKLLSQFWGHPIYIGATLLLPKEYETHPDVYYPAVYEQGHFSLGTPMGFRTDPPEESEEVILRRRLRGLENGYEFYKSWTSDHFPRMIVVTFQHPTPYFDDSYAVNSANNGPYADALIKELIPYLEKNFRMIPKAYARLLTGGSTGGYESLALQVHHPRFFGGTWTFYPDPIDFRRFFLINIYEDENAFVAPGFKWLKPERYSFRSREGQPIQSVRQLSQLTMVLGSRGRSCEYLEAWEASFGPVGSDGYTMPLWDKKTGEIDHEVAQYWRDNGYDLFHYIKTNWSTIGPDLVGKIHMYVGDMDNYYFNLPVYFLEELLENTENPYYEGSFHYGRPLMQHGWHPMTRAELIRIMADHATKNSSPGEDTKMWRYD